MEPVLGEQLLALFRVMRQRIQHVAERHGLSYPQLVTLRYLLHAGSVPMSEVTDYLGITRGAMTGLVDRLADAGLVVRRPCEQDRRVTFLDLTPRGREVLAQVQGHWLEESERWAVRLDDRERAVVSSALDSLLRAAGSDG